MKEHVAVRCKPSTARACRCTLDRYFLPVFGSRVLGSIGREEVAALQYRLHKTPIMANRVVDMLSRLFNVAEAWELHQVARIRPVRAKYKERSRERFLSEDEFRRLGGVLGEVEAEGGISPSAVAAIRLLMLTGCRRGEIVSLRWETWTWRRASYGCATQRRGRGRSHCHRLRCECCRQSSTRGYPMGHFRSQAGNAPWNLNTSWLVVRARAGLEDVRLHDLRHSFASRALALGESLAMIGKLLGPPEGANDRALRPPRAGLGESRGGKSCGKLRADMVRSGHTVTEDTAR